MFILACAGICNNIYQSRGTKQLYMVTWLVVNGVHRGRSMDDARISFEMSSKSERKHSRTSLERRRRG
uniref:Ovule protein n=1 Tax=Heterorhabditis bacteriophora TaxID=37862 RepID=A0A1I7XLT0_HETBA